MIKKAKNKDVGLLVSWMENLLAHVQKSSKDIYTNSVSEDFKGTFPSWFENSIKDPNKIILISEKENKKVGFISASIQKPYLAHCKILDIGSIDVCWIDETYRKKGIMTEMVNEVEKWFKSKKIDYVDVAYLKGNIEAENTWKHLDYNPYRIFSRKRL